MNNTSHTAVYGDFATKVLSVSNDIQAIIEESRTLEAVDMSPKQFARYCVLGDRLNHYDDLLSDLPELGFAPLQDW